MQIFARIVHLDKYSKVSYESWMKANVMFPFFKDPKETESNESAQFVAQFLIATLKHEQPRYIKLHIQLLQASSREKTRSLEYCASAKSRLTDMGESSDKFSLAFAANAQPEKRQTNVIQPYFDEYFTYVF